MRIFKENKGTLRCRLFGHSWSFPMHMLGHTSPIMSSDYRCIRCGTNRTDSLVEKEYNKKWLEFHKRNEIELKKQRVEFYEDLHH